MILNERPSPYGRQPYGFHKFHEFKPKPRTAENTVHRNEFLIEQKIFTVILKENQRGRYLRIVETSVNGERYSSLIVPVEGMKDFQKMLAKMVKAHEEMPSGQAAAPA